MTPEPVVLRAYPAERHPQRRVLLLHGLANGAPFWGEVLARRPQWMECWTAELPWRVDGPLDWSHSGDLPGWIAAAVTGVVGTADTIVAHSFSANLLLELAARDAGALERLGVQRLVLVAPFYRRRPEDFRWEAMDGLHEDFVKIVEEGIRAYTHRTIAPERRTEMARRVCERVGPYGWTRFFETYLRTPWLRTDLIHVPTLVVTGGQDVAAAEACDLAEDLPDGTLEVEPQCGHFPMVENAAWFTTVLSRFLDPDLPQFLSDRRAPSVTVGAKGWMR